MTSKTTNTKLRMTGIAGAFILAATLFTAPAANAGERAGHRAGDGGPRIERDFDRDRRAGRRDRRRVERRAHRRVERRAHRRAERRAHKRGHRYTYRYGPRYRQGPRYDTHRGHRHGYGYRHRYGHRHGVNLGPVAVGVGLGILTYALIDAHNN